MGFFSWFFGGLAKATLSDEITGESGPCCKNCRFFTGDSSEKYGDFICEEIGEVKYDNYKENRNIKKDCICNTYYGKANYFKWK